MIKHCLSRDALVTYKTAIKKKGKYISRAEVQTFEKGEFLDMLEYSIPNTWQQAMVLQVVDLLNIPFQKF